MASNKVVLTISVDDKGSLKVVEKDAKKAAGALNRTSKAADKTGDSMKNAGKSAAFHNKQQKGVAGATANSTKGFSKMTTGITSGIVPAYAVLASNIFALTAAFGALSRAAKLEDLTKGLQFMGNVAGQNLKEMAVAIRGVTGEAVSMGEAMRTTAIGISAGFRGDQLLELTKVAKGASIALGRDLGDALSRLTRGVAKLEPEILDELGILVRLDDATETYATQLGVGAESLSQFQRQQAFMNATIDQGIKKYGDIADAIDINVYNKLSASLADLAQKFGGILNNTLGLNTAVEFLADNSLALIGIVSLLGVQITRTIAPGMFAMAAASAQNAKAVAKSNAALIKNVDVTGKMPKIYNDLLPKIKKGTITTAEMAKAQDSLTSSIRTHEGQLRVDTKGTYKNVKAKKAKEAAIVDIRNRLQELKNVQASSLAAQSMSSRADAVGAASKFRMVTAVRLLIQAHREEVLAIKSADIAMGTSSKAMNLYRLSIFSLTGALKVMGAAFFAILPWVGILVTVGTVLVGFFKKEKTAAELMAEQVDKAIESFENFSKITEQFESSSSTGSTRVVNAYIAYAGILDTVKSKLMEIINLERAAMGETAAAARKDVEDAEDKLAKLKAEQNKAVLSKDINPAASKFTAAGINTLGLNDEFIKSVQINVAEKELKAANKELADFKVKLDNIDVITAENTRDSMVRVISGAIDAIKVEAAISGEKGLITLIGKDEMANLDGLMGRMQDVSDKQFLTEGVFDPSKALVAFGVIQNNAATIRSSFTGIQDSVAKFSQALNKFRQKEKGPFSNILSGAEAIQDKFDDLNKTTLSKEKREELKKELQTSLDGLSIPDVFKNGMPGLKSYITFIKTAEEDLKKMGVESKKLEVQASKLLKITKDIPGGVGALIEAQNASHQSQIALLTKENELSQALLDKGEDTLLNSKAITSNNLKMAKLEEKLVSGPIQRLLVEQDLLQIKEEQHKVAEAQAKLETSLIKNALTLVSIKEGRGGTLTETDKFNLAVRTAELQIDTAKRTLEMESVKADIQKAILKVQLATTDLSVEAQDKLLAGLDKQLALQKEAGKIAVKNAEANLRATKLGGGSSGGSSLSGGQTDFAQSMKDALTQGDARIKAVKESANLGDAQDDLAGYKALAAGAEKFFGKASADYKTYSAQASDAALAVSAANAAIAQSYIGLMADAMSPFIESLKALGPEGEAVAAMAEGAISIASSITVLADSSSSAGQKLQAASNIIGSIMSITAASSDAKIAGIDAEINAEKKRDGQSAKSVAKLQAMEAKKERMKRKAFEKNKKMMMAQTVLNTAAAVMVALATTGEIYSGIAMAAVTAVLGAAQLAVIAGTSYQGGGTGASSAGVSSVSVGERANTVDLAKSNSASGEQAYMRGASGTGTGNATNFVPGRAAGGRVSFPVGEQGPEDFVPDRPGVIVPAGQSTNTGGAPLSVSFQVNTIDSQGMEEALTKQRGNIIKMIREAANDHGEFFLEDVNVLEDESRL